MLKLTIQTDIVHITENIAKTVYTIIIETIADGMTADGTIADGTVAESTMVRDIIMTDIIDVLILILNLYFQ